MPLSVTSMARKGCSSWVVSQGLRSDGAVTVPGSIRDHLNAQIHFQPGDTHLFFSFFHALGIDLGVIGFGCVGIDANLVAKLAAAHHGIYGRVVDLAGNVPQRHFDGANSSGLARRTAKLFDLAEKLVELQRVLADDAALQKQGVSGAGAVAYFTKSVNALIGIDSNDRAGTGAGLDHRSDAQVGDLQRRRA